MHTQQVHTANRIYNPIFIVANISEEPVVVFIANMRVTTKTSQIPISIVFAHQGLRISLKITKKFYHIDFINCGTSNQA